MGIKELNNFLLKNTKNAIQNKSLQDFYNKKVAIDTSIFLYKYKYRTANFIPKFLEQINRLRLNKITPIYIFDGKPPPEKSEVLLKRKNKKIERVKKIMALEEEINISPINTPNSQDLLASLEKLKKGNIYVTKNDIDTLKEFFKMLDIKFIQSEGEADILCCDLYKQGLVDMVMSEDLDILTGNTKILLRNFNYNSNTITVYNLDIILQELEITYDKWVKLCILFGCDYLKRIHYVGPVFSYNIIKNLDIDDNNIIENEINVIIQRVLKKKKGNNTR